jgi:hypothetical protein
MQEQIDEVEKHLGNAGRMKELREHTEAVSRLVAGNVAADVVVRLRTQFFDDAVDRLVLLQQMHRVHVEDQAVSASFLVESLTDALGDIEAAMRWFKEPPAPQSTKHSAEHAWTIASEAAQSLEALRREQPR